MYSYQNSCKSIGFLFQSHLRRHGAGRTFAIGTTTGRSWAPSSLPIVETCTSQSRWFSSRKKRKRFKLDTLPFSVSPQEAMMKFDQWATSEQGLPYYKVHVSAAFVPVWSFDLNVRFKTFLDTTGSARSSTYSYSWKPNALNAAYPEQEIIHLPGLATYSGYTYRRTLVDPVHNKTLLFMGDKTIPFNPKMLDDMTFVDPESGEKKTIQVFPDPWNATESSALNIVKDQLTDDMEKMMNSRSENIQTNIEIQVVSSRRVYLPTYIFDYSVLGGGDGYRSFISGCDAGMPVSGISHQTFSIFEDSLSTISTNIPGPVAIWLTSTFGNVAIRNITTFIGRVVFKYPFFAIITVGAFKFVIPRMRNHLTLEQWKEQREYDATRPPEEYHHADHFEDTSFGAQRYFELHREAILRILSQINEFNFSHFGSQGPREGYRNYGGRYQERRRGGTYENHNNNKRTNNYEEDRVNQNNFGRNNPYSILGLKKSAKMSEVSAAFRREMLKYHPDMNANATEAEKLKALERSKLITEAYRKIKQTART